MKNVTMIVVLVLGFCGMSYAQDTPNNRLHGDVEFETEVHSGEVTPQVKTFLTYGGKGKLGAYCWIQNSKAYEASLFKQNCSICHGPEAEGKTLGDGRSIPNIRDGEHKYKTADQIYNHIANGGNDDALITGLRALGHTVNTAQQSSGIATIVRRTAADGSEVLDGGADPRREGAALGDLLIFK